MSVLGLSQVGINNASPDPSSILDVTATDKGMLIPRMPLASIQSIDSPAQGLMVFETSSNVFMYYTGAQWIEIGESLQRDNFKLIKSIADLAEEDTGSVYQLDTNTLYQINGTILLDKPINLNNAYLEGSDSIEDIILNTGTGAMFDGSTGGSIRNLTMSGNGSNSIFNLVGTDNSQTLLLNNNIIANSSSVGTIERFELVFFSITQFVQNGSGIISNTNTSFQMSTVFWTTSNTGTFLTIDGNHDNIQLAAGRIEVGSSETGLDVSSNPSITDSASMSEISFVGAGTFVDAYTVGSYPGYNFNNRWVVRCPGIPLESDSNAAANIYFTGSLTTGFTQTITNNTAVEIQGNGSFNGTNLYRFSTGTPANEIVYEGRDRRFVQVNASLSIRVTGATGDFYAFSIAVDGNIIVETNAVVQINSDTNVQNISLNGEIEIEPGERIQIFAQRLTGFGDDGLVVFSENFSVQ